MTTDMKIESQNKKSVLDDIDPKLLESVQFVNGTFFLTQPFVDHMQSVVPDVNITRVASDCANWIIDLSEGFHGFPGTTLLKFIKREAAIGKLPKASLTGFSGQGKGQVRTTGPSSPQADLVRLANLMTMMRVCKEGGAEFDIEKHLEKTSYLKQFAKGGRLDIITRGAEAVKQDLEEEILDRGNLKNNRAVIVINKEPATFETTVNIPSAAYLLEDALVLVPEPESLVIFELSQDKPIGICVSPAQYLSKPRARIAKKKTEIINKAMAVREIEHKNGVARMDHALIMSGIFRNISRKEKFTEEKPRPRIDKEQNCGGVDENGVQRYIRFRGDGLGEYHLSLLLIFMFIAAEQIQVQAIPDLDTELSFHLKTTRARVLKELGVQKSGQRIKAMNEAIILLSGIQIIGLDNKNKFTTQHLIINASGDGNEAINISLNYRLMQALLATGSKGGGTYTALNLREYMKLPRGAARIMYVYFKALKFNRHDLGIIKKEKLIERVFGYVSTVKQVLHDQREKIDICLDLVRVLPSFNECILPIYK